MSGDLKPGLEVVLGGTTFQMPCLSAAATRKYWDRIQAMNAGLEPQPLDLVARLVHACLLRNYPNVSFEFVEENVDFDNSEALGVKAFGAGSWNRWCQAQTALAAQGNATAPQTTSGTGAPSSLASSQPPAGDSTKSES
jgi:hypothetical protein